MTLKRLAWVYGCALKGSHQEAEALHDLLYAVHFGDPEEPASPEYIAGKIAEVREKLEKA